MSNPGDDSEFNQNNESLLGRALRMLGRVGERRISWSTMQGGIFSKPWGDTAPDKCNSILNANVAPMVGMSRRLAIPMSKAKWEP
jgi:hypothetical protein